jgi:PHD/YefM family antitoxin component YafN of YafNO toxin-antitoxin module
MAKVKENFIVNKKGQKRAVVLDLRDYLRLIEHLEDLEDALELDRAERKAKSFRDYKDIRAELVHEGRL